MRIFLSMLAAAVLSSAAFAQKSEPANVYLFPAGGQRGTRVEVSIEGENVTSLCDFHLAPNHGVTAPAAARDRKITLTIAPDAPLGPVPFRIATAQGGSTTRVFVVGEYPEALETEPGVDDPTPQPVTLPVTVNGRLNPAGDVDRFSFQLRAGQPFSAEVMAARLGGPIDTNCFTGQFGNPSEDPADRQLDATLELYGPDGQLLRRAEDTFGLDPALGLVAPRDGRYVVAVRHMAYVGRPQFVYRLSLAPVPLVQAAFPAGGQRGSTEKVTFAGEGIPNGAGAEVHVDRHPGPVLARLPGGSTSYPLRPSELPNVLEREPNDTPATATPVSLPCVMNGRFQTPGDTDIYRAAMRKGETWRLEAWIERLGTPTDASLTVLSPAGKVLAEANAGPPGARDPQLFFTVPADGEYLLQIRETAMSRLGERLVYRLEAARQPPDFRLELGAEIVDSQPGAAGTVEVAVSRLGGFAGAVQVSVHGLPDGVAAPPIELQSGQQKGKLTFTAAAGCRSGSWTISATGKALIDGAEITRAALAPVANPAEPALNSAPRSVEDLLLTLRYPAPFRIEADDSYLFLNLGSMHPAAVFVTRQPGFTEPILLTMADRQPRDPYGITFPPLSVAGQDRKVFFPMRLPQGPRGNQIVRVYIKAETVVRDTNGREWHLLQTSPKQVVSRTTAPVLSLSVEPDALRASRGSIVPLHFLVGRTPATRGPAEVRLLADPGVRGVRLDPVTVAAGEQAGTGNLHVAPDADFGRISELRFEVTSRCDNGQTVFYQARLQFDLHR